MFKQHIPNFVQLGKILNKHFQTQSSIWLDLCEKAYVLNGWFTKDNIELQFNSWIILLEEENINTWLIAYKAEACTSKNVGIICAGNIPLVGLHDVFCTIISNNVAHIKLATEDTLLMKFVLEALIETNTKYASQIKYVDRLNGMDAIIATGSNNSARYFHYYFGKKPHIIRKNRNSVAIVNNNITEKELDFLSNDIFYFFGLGCRNVSKLYIEKEFNIDRLFNSFFKHNEIINNKKYGNNFDYNRALLLMKVIPFLENNFVILKQDTALATPVGVINYELYTDITLLNNILLNERENIQCIVTNNNIVLENLTTVLYGNSQSPKWNDYADDIDTFSFLLKI